MSFSNDDLSKVALRKIYFMQGYASIKSIATNAAFPEQLQLINSGRISFRTVTSDFLPIFGKDLQAPASP